ncbi:type 4a pilus biogenesis protein PilO [uncultured Psychrobacter sp.]|uniref:type 4a pilus biogenesis protein PilO n=1 Tax=uncultured Psychrobacter sp. TaxID=259303 RepID=UPI002604F052|nr:type 4a pilus biogenesis protein PilO [uncultured Psychrobacter sp.]
MKLSRKKSLIKTKKTAVSTKKPFDLNEFRRSFESLDAENYGSWPLSVKVTVIGFIIALIAALSWALPISSKIDEITAAESQQQTLLDQLPKDTRVSELVEGINMTGVGSNIRFQDISVEPEIENEFFIEQPIRIAALGEYHQFGSFISGLAALPRIITMHDFEVSNPQPTLDVLPELNLVLQTKTYRSKEAAPEGDEAVAPDAATTDAAGGN